MKLCTVPSLTVCKSIQKNLPLEILNTDCSLQDLAFLQMCCPVVFVMVLKCSHGVDRDF